MGNSVNVRVGRKIRQLRWQNGMSQKVLAVRLGVPLSELEQYEMGEKTVSADLLWQVASVFDLRVGDFFPLMGDEAPQVVKQVACLADLVMDRQAMQLIKAYDGLSAEERRRLFPISTVEKRKS